VAWLLPSTANVLPSGSLNHATFPPPALGDIPRSVGRQPLVVLEGHTPGAEPVDHVLDIVRYRVASVAVDLPAWLGDG
jgi:hypothetical protein